MTGQNFMNISKHQAAAAFTAQENNLHQRQQHRLAVSMVGACRIAACPIYAAVRAHFGPQYRLNLTDAFVGFSRLPETGSDLTGQAELLSLSQPQEQGKHSKV